MTIISRIFLSLIGLTGVSSAIGIPVAYNSQSRKRRLVEEEQGGGGVSQVAMNKCSASGNENRKDINFGDSTENDVCWDSELNSLTSENSGKYTELFKEQWGDKERNWNGNSNTSLWTQQCLDQTSPWVVLSPSNNTGFQYLGMCGNSNLESTVFAKKVKGSTVPGNLDVWTLSICSSDCWEVNRGTMGGSPEALTTEKSQNWKTVKFYYNGESKMLKSN